MRARAHTLLLPLVAGAAYFFAARAGTLLVDEPDAIASIWLAGGVLLATLLATRARAWRAIGVATLVGAIAAVLVDGDPTPATAVTAAAGWAEGLLAAAILVRLTDGRPSLGRLRDVGALLVAAASACAIGALAAAAALASETGASFGSTWLIWWSADSVGMLAIAPVALALREAGFRPTRRGLAESVLLLAAVAGVSLLVFGADPSVGGLRSALPAALVLPLLVVASLRLGAVPATLGNLAVALIAARMTIEEHGPFANALASAGDRLLGMRSFLAVALGVSLAAMALASQHRRLRRAEDQRDAERRRVREIIGTSFHGVIALDEDGIVTEWNEGARRAFGWSRDEALGRPLAETIVPDKLQLPFEATLEVLRRAGEVSGIGETLELQARGKWGRDVPIEVTVSTVRDPNGLSFHIAVKDLYELHELEAAAARAAKSEDDRRRMEDELRQARLQASQAELLQRAAAAEHERVMDASEAERRQLGRSFEDAPVAMALADSSGGLTRVNTALCELTGMQREHLEAATVDQLVHPGDREPLAAGLRPFTERTSRRWHSEMRLVDARRQELPVDLGVTLLSEDLLLVHVQDLRERRRAQERVAFLADHDFLTGLPDRVHLERELETAAAGALVVVDLDGLRSLNQSLGKVAGDALLAETSRVLRERVRRSDAVSRIGGDAFAIVLEGAREDDARSLAEELLDAVRSLKAVDGRSVSASAGVLLFTGSEGLSAEELIVEAELALYDAKEAGRDRAVARQAASNLAASQQPAKLEAPDWAERIRGALSDDCFVLHAQPIVSLKGETPSRYELLLRLMGDDGDLVPPTTFLYVAERFGLAQELDRWVIGEAAALLARTEAEGRDLRLEVNLSESSVTDPGLPELIARELATAKASGSRLSLAIDEATAIENVESVRVLSQSVRSLGCELVLDRFGSGLASFHYLQQIAVDYVKIDGSFVKDLPHNRAGRMVVKSVVEVASSLGCRTIAERVGDSETLALIQDHGVDFAQGFFVGRPRPAAELATADTPPPAGGSELRQSG